MELITHAKIDKQKWDRNLSRATFRHPAMQSWYLDIVCPRWSALVYGDYDACMAINLQRKFGLPYVSKPDFIQQMGVLAHTSTSVPHRFDAFLKQKHWLIEMPSNETDVLEIDNSTILQNNFCLQLDADYHSIHRQYNTNTKRNIKKAVNFGLETFKIDNLSQITEFFETYTDRNPVEQKHLALINKLMSCPEGKEQFIPYAVRNAQGTILSIALLLSHFGRHIYVLATSSPEGIAQKAMFLLVDAFIRDHCGNAGSLLDFEGSNFEGIAKFYKGFGAENRPYPFIKRNQLRWPANQIIARLRN